MRRRSGEFQTCQEHLRGLFGKAQPPPDTQGSMGIHTSLKVH